MAAHTGAMDQPTVSCNGNNPYEPKILHILKDVFFPMWILFSFVEPLYLLLVNIFFGIHLF